MSDFPSIPLGEIAALQAGVGFPVDLQGRSAGDYPVAKVGDISRVGRSGGAVIIGADHYIDEGDLARLRARPIPPGSVLFAKIGEAIRQNHRVIAGCPLLVDNNAMAAIPTKRVDSRYLYHFLRTVDFYRLASSTTVPALRKSELERLPVPLAPIRAQRQIVQVLDRAEALRAKRRAALAQLDNLTQALFLDLFGEPEAHGWPEPSIESLLADQPNAIRTGPFGSQLLHSEFVESGIAVLGIDNAVQNQFLWGRPRFISERKYEQLRRYTVHPGDVLITIMATCGRCAVVPQDIPTAINTKHLCCVTLDQSRCLPSYLHACFLRHPRVLHRLGVRERGAVMPGLNMGIIKELRIPLPPISLQREFTRRVAAVEKLKATHRTSLAELDALFAALQHRAFRGEL